MDSEIKKFLREKKIRIKNQGVNKKLKLDAKRFFVNSHENKYSYNFNWLGRPIIQYPQDIVAFQEIVYEVKPELIIETGIAHGGSIILSASLLSLLDIMNGINPKNSATKVVGIDIDIRKHNYNEIINHPLNYKIELLEGSSLDKKIEKKISRIASRFKKILVVLDSNHTYDHVLKELNIYSKFVSIKSYCIVFDTCLDEVNEKSYANRPWSKTNNPMIAVKDWLKNNEEFKVDFNYDNKLLISAAPNGFLKKVK